MPGYCMSPKAIKAYNKRNPRACIYTSESVLRNPIFKVSGFGCERLVHSKRFLAECVAALKAVIERHGVKARTAEV